jgi:hypothetical protein
VIGEEVKYSGRHPRIDSKPRGVYLIITATRSKYPLLFDGALLYGVGEPPLIGQEFMKFEDKDQVTVGHGCSLDFDQGKRVGC